MSIVGGFPGMNRGHRATMRSPVNPMDKSTIISIYPRLINEIHHTIQPGRFRVEPGTFDRPSVLTVGPSSWWKDIDIDQPLLEIPNSSVQVADAVVKGFCSGLLGSNMGDSMPGIYWVPGEFSSAEVKKTQATLLDKAKAKQVRYYTALIKMADGLWARTNGNPLVISDDMRLAANELQLTQGKEWMKDFTMLTKNNCPACGFMVNLEYPVCSNCHNVLDKIKAEKLGLVFAVPSVANK